jgi:undecaprenyl-diphosphatase
VSRGGLADELVQGGPAVGAPEERMDWSGADAAALEWAYGLGLPILPVALVSHIATRGGLWLVAGLGLSVFGRERMRRTGLAVLSGLVLHVLVLEGVVKHAVARARPFAALGLELRDGLVNPDSYSFPSGHSAASFLGAWILGCAFPRWRSPLLAIATLVALSRLHLGAHYPSDVVAGAFFGLCLGVILARVFRVAAVDDEAQPEDSPAAGL